MTRSSGKGQVCDRRSDGVAGYRDAIPALLSGATRQSRAGDAKTFRQRFG
jgi:hypothetical protein